MKKILCCGMAALLSLLLLTGMAMGEEAASLPVDFSGGMPLHTTFDESPNVYDDPTIHVERMHEQSKEYGCTYYKVDIKIASPTQLRTESAMGGAKGFNSRQKVSVPVMARRVNAVVAMNGDYFSEHAGALVLRQGVMFREPKETYHDLLLIDEAGDFHVILAGNRDVEEGYGNKFPSTPLTTEMLTMADGKKIINGLDFGPCIILNGQPVEAHHRSIVHPAKTQSWNPAQRIALCQVGPLEYRIVAVARYGLSVQDFTKLVLSLGDVQTAYMLDGGLSAQIVYLGRKVNNTQDKNPRAVSDCIYFASAYQGE